MNVKPNTVQLITLDGKQSVTLAFFGAFRINEVDNFDTKIIAGYNTIFKNVDVRNTGSTSYWRNSVDSSGNYLLKPLSGLAGNLTLNTNGNTLAGEFAYRQKITTDVGTSIAINGTSNGHIRYCTSNSPTIISINEFVTDGLNNFSTNGFFDVIQAGNGSVTIAGENVSVSINALGGLPKTVSKGDRLHVICKAQNVYEVFGNIQRPSKDKTVTLTSSAGILTIDWSLGQHFVLTLTENITSVVHINLPTGNVSQDIIIRITQHASALKTINRLVWDVLWFEDAGAYVPTSALSAVDEVAMTCYGDSSQIIAKYSKKAVVAV